MQQQHSIKINAQKSKCAKLTFYKTKTKTKKLTLKFRKQNIIKTKNIKVN